MLWNIGYQNDQKLKNSYTIVLKGNQTVTLYEDDGKTVFGVYKYNKNGVINKVESYCKGKIQHVEVNK